SATGTSPFAGRSSAGSAARATDEPLMCRHLAYLGPPTALSDLLFDAPHSLTHQARCPRLQISGETNPDGWGVAWYAPSDPAPEWYRTVTPIWDDDGFAR